MTTTSIDSLQTNLPRKGRLRLGEFEYLRALAIIVIILGHSIMSIPSRPDILFPMLPENIIRGWTAVFVFISGFFFHNIYSYNFNYKKFLIKKFQLVWQPYMVILLASIMIELIINISYGFNLTIFIKQISGIWKKGFIDYIHWYIPFIMLVFIASPLYIKFIDYGLRIQIAIFFVLCITSLFIHRPFKNINLIQSLIYFSPFYLAGILYSLYHDWFLKHAKTLGIIAFIFFVSALYVQTSLYEHRGSYHKKYYEYDFIDFMFLQKISLILFLMPLLKLFCDRLPPGKTSKEIAQMSFALFFIHPLVDKVLNILFIHYKMHEHADIFGKTSILLTIIKFGITLTLTIGIIKLIKQYSTLDTKKIIGY